jgi:hypothetical protein
VQFASISLLYSFIKFQFQDYLLSYLLDDLVIQVLSFRLRFLFGVSQIGPHSFEHLLEGI